MRRRRRLIVIVLFLVALSWFLGELYSRNELSAVPYDETIPSLKIQRQNSQKYTKSGGNQKSGTVLKQAILKTKKVEKPSGSRLRLIYNRVPKCGSRSLLTLFKTLAKQNNFKLFEGSNYPYALDQKRLKNTSDLISKLEPPFIYQRHFHYTTFPQHVPVVYINLVRDPLARSVSHYYFRRHGDGILGKSRAHRRNVLNETYDECVLKRRDECVGNWGRFFIVPFFCGHTPECRSPTRWALDHAKHNVANKYLVVGLLEEFDDFVKVLEQLLPRLFKGAYKTWLEPDVHPKAVISKTRQKRLPSERVVKLMKERMALEYEFYEFIKNRFHALKQDLQV